MLISKIPIFITARGNNKEIFEINKIALQYAYIFIKEIDMFDQTYIISDNKDLLDYATSLGFTNTIHYICGNDKDLLYLEYFATYRYGIEHNFYPDWIIILNINQVFRRVSLLRDCINNIDDNYDIVASYTTISDKSHFFIDSITNNSNKKHLLSSDQHRVQMIDNAIYAVKTSFAFECMKYDDPSEYFWNGNIKYFENHSLYTDIYQLSDLDKYDSVYKILNDFKKMNDNTKT